MMRPLFLVTLMALAAAAGTAAAETSATATTEASSIPAFFALEKLKKLAGEWQGTVDDKENGPKVAVTYKSTSGGSAVIETQFPGTRHEMVTVYHLDGKQLVLTHYCAMGNQPRMALSNASKEDEFVFDYSGGTNVDPKQDMHMHGLRIRFEGPTAITTEWQLYKEGKPTGTTRLYLSKKG